MLPFERLTDRQCECLRLVALGYTSKEIAAQLGGLSYNTVDNHIAAALDTLNLSNRAEAARGLVAFEAASARATSAPLHLAPADELEPIQPTAGVSLMRFIPPLGGRLHDLNAEGRVSAILVISILGFVTLIVLTLATTVLLMLLR